MNGYVWRGEVTDRAGHAGVAISTGVLLAHELVLLTPGGSCSTTP